MCSRKQANLHWDAKEQAVDFFDVKADVSFIKGTGHLSKLTFEKASHPALHPGMSAHKTNDEVVGWLGAVHPQHAKPGFERPRLRFRSHANALFLVFCLRLKAISRYPSNKRDIAITVKQEIEVGKILSYIEKFGVNQLVGLNLFDVYTGQGVEPGYKSLALSLTLQDADKTLEDAEIQAAVDKVLDALASEFGASLRE